MSLIRELKEIFKECKHWYEYVAITGMIITAIMFVIAIFAGIAFVIFLICTLLGVPGVILSLLFFFWLISLIVWVRNV